MRNIFRLVSVPMCLGVSVCGSAAVMHTNAKIKNLYFWLFSSIYDVHIYLCTKTYTIFLFIFVFLLTAEIDLTHHKVAAFVVLVACYACSHSPFAPIFLLVGLSLSFLLLLMARCYCLLDFNILAANKYEIRRNLNSMQRDQQTLTSEQAEQHKLLVSNTNTNKFHSEHKYESRHTQTKKEKWGGRDTDCIRMPKVWTIKIYEAIKVRARLAVFYGQGVRRCGLRVVAA